VHFRGVGLQFGRLRVHGDGFAHGPDLERDIDTRDAVDTDINFGALDGLEPLLADLHRVDTGRHVREVEMARGVGDGLTGQAGVLVGDDDVGARNRRLCRVFDIAQDRAIEHLGRGWPGDQTNQNQSTTHERRQQHAPPPGSYAHGNLPQKVDNVQGLLRED
jgi:hypothetical protein